MYILFCFVSYYWWVRDHWNRPYSGRVKCCCVDSMEIPGTTSGARTMDLRGIVNGCDYRAQVTIDHHECRDANEDHNGGRMGSGFLYGFDGPCPLASDGRSVAYTREPADEMCWEILNFGIPGINHHFFKQFSGMISVDILKIWRFFGGVSSIFFRVTLRSFIRTQMTCSEKFYRWNCFWYLYFRILSPANEQKIRFWPYCDFIKVCATLFKAKNSMITHVTLKDYFRAKTSGVMENLCHTKIIQDTRKSSYLIFVINSWVVRMILVSDTTSSFSISALVLSQKTLKICNISGHMCV